MFKNIFSILSIALMFVATISKAQTPMQINGLDCNGVSHDMFSELDAGKAVVVFFFMDNCGSCPPVAQKVQTMVNNILVSYPNMVTAYAMPYNNTTTCTATADWVTNNNLMLYAPYDSGAVQVANYGGFGMPSVVLLGGKSPDRRVMFSTLSFSNSDTTIMHDSILALFAPVGVNDVAQNIHSADIYPNPSTGMVNISVELKALSDLQIDVTDMTGNLIANISKDRDQQGIVNKQFNTEGLASGVYCIRIRAGGKTSNRKLNVIH
ncbi:MAG: T9SS type A sorting domain-containing protein [Chitinophagaceae bacterium]|nr:T9SS type A sorting domain-containing protein [Chitinophagaceae bacterium]